MDYAVKIRPLTQDDRERLTVLIESLISKVGSGKFRNLITSDESDVAGGKTKKDDSGYIHLGIELLTLMVQFIDAEIKPWFISLAGVTEEEFKKLPFDIEMQIIEQIMEAPEVNSFFSTPSRLVKKMRGFVDGLKGGSDQ
jgi:hypothetical protein